MTEFTGVGVGECRGEGVGCWCCLDGVVCWMLYEGSFVTEILSVQVGSKILNFHI